MKRSPSRRGAIAPLTALLMIPLLALLAFAIDIGWITHTHNELQSAADAAALAGAGQLADDFVRYHLPGQSQDQKDAIRQGAVAKAKQWAKTYAAHNRAGDRDSLTLLDDDIELGFTANDGTYTALPTYTGYPNTVKVLLRRDKTANQPLPTFFARVLGIGSVDLDATATAGLQAGTIDGFKSSTIRSRILPMTYDVNHWNGFCRSGLDPDGNRDLTAAGEAQLSIYSELKDRGNFGELSLDQGNDGSSVIKEWISNGVSQADLQANYTKGLLPLSKHDPNSFPDWKGNPGLKTSTIQEVGDNVGELYLLPLYKPYNDGTSGEYQAGQGQGSNYYYTIVAFVGVRITAVDSTGNDKSIKVQPSSLIDPNALYTSAGVAQPPSATSTMPTTFLGARLLK